MKYIRYALYLLGAIAYALAMVYVMPVVCDAKYVSASSFEAIERNCHALRQSESFFKQPINTPGSARSFALHYMSLENGSSRAWYHVRFVKQLGYFRGILHMLRYEFLHGIKIEFFLLWLRLRGYTVVRSADALQSIVKQYNIVDVEVIRLATGIKMSKQVIFPERHNPERKFVFFYEGKTEERRILQLIDSGLLPKVSSPKLITYKNGAFAGCSWCYYDQHKSETLSEYFEYIDGQILCIQF